MDVAPDRKTAKGRFRYIIKATSDPAVGFAKCARMCLDLAGRFDALTGRYLTPEDNFAALARQVRASGG